MPTSADADGRLVLIFVSVKSPVTSDGVIFNVTPLPLEVEIWDEKMVVPVPPPRTPPAPIEQVAAVALALKFPLDCAKATGAINIAIASALLYLIIFIFWPSSNIKRSNLKLREPEFHIRVRPTT